MKNEKYTVETSEEAAVERWENEGGGVLKISEFKAIYRVILIYKKPLPTNKI